jgi:hypothetical protein
MLFDQAPRELPVATVRSRGRTAVIAAGQRWFASKWSWLRPRMVPVAVAFVGMIAVLASANALTLMAKKAPGPVATIPATKAEKLAESAETLRLFAAAPSSEPNVFAMFPGSSMRFIPHCER